MATISTYDGTYEEADEGAQSVTGSGFIINHRSSGNAVTLTVDLLVGIAAGVIAKMILHWWHGTPPSVIFRNEIEVQPIETTTYRVTVRKAAIFANWLIIKRELLQLGLQANILLDLSEACFVDHTVMEKLHGLAADFKASGGRLEIIGLESHSKLSDHSFAARKKKSEPVADPS